MDTGEILARVPIFSEMSNKDLRRMAKVAQTRSYKRGDTIIKEGELATAFYVVVSGKVEVVQGAEGRQPRVLNNLGPGEFFGEMALWENYPRNASVRALEDTQCLLVTRWDFQAELRSTPTIAVQMLPVLMRRLRQAEARPAD